MVSANIWDLDPTHPTLDPAPWDLDPTLFILGSGPLLQKAQEQTLTPKGHKSAFFMGIYQMGIACDLSSRGRRIASA